MPDVIIVLGNDPRPSKKIPDLMKSRLNACINYYQKIPSPVILSGGYALSYEKDPGFREAKIMKDFLLKKGIPKEKIILECKSRDTAGNALFTKQIVQKHNWKNILIITSDFHIKRTKTTFNFIYGNGYKIKVKGIKTNFPSEKAREIKKRELHSIKGLKQVCKLNNIKKGDHSAIAKLLKKFYANYHNKEQ
jgi:uncharacterized SAM-binding protein YcdF (DUF218 family)